MVTSDDVKEFINGELAHIKKMRERGKYEFRAIDNIGDTAIKTYRSIKIAESSFRRSWWHADELIEAGRIEFVKVVEQVCTVGFHEWLNEVKKQ